MNKIIFTKEHKEKLDTLVLKFLFAGKTLQTNLGQYITVYDVIHTQTINTLEKMRVALKKAVANAEDADEFTVTENEQAKIADLRDKYDLVNLAIGYKRYQSQVADNARKLREAKLNLAELRESTKTPEDRIKELEAQINEMEQF